MKLNVLLIHTASLGPRLRALTSHLIRLIVRNMATSLILQSFPVVLSSLYVESKILPQYFQQLFENSLNSLPKAYGGVILVNVVFSGLYLVVLGMKVGQARKKYTDKVRFTYFYILTRVRRLKMVKKMLKNGILCQIYMLMATLRTQDYLIVSKEAINKRLRRIRNS